MHPGSNRRRDQARGAKARLRRTLVVAGSAASLAVAWPALGVWAGPTASKVWVSSYDGEAHGPDFATAAEVSPDGSRVYVTGGSTGSYALGRSFDFATIAYDTGTGEPDWISRYNGPGDPGRGFDDTATAMAISQDGSRVFVTGNSAGHGTRSDYATIAYDATTGTPTWISRYDGPGSHDDLPTSIVVSPDGSKVFVTGGSLSGVDDYETVAYDAETGGQLWVRTYDGPGHSDDVARSVTVSPDGSLVFVTGSSVGAGTNYDYATIAYDATTGSDLWTERYDGGVSAEDYASRVIVSPDGTQVFVSGGTTADFGNQLDYGTIAYDAATGAPQWIARYNGPGVDSSWDQALAMAVSPDGTRLIVTGKSIGTAGFEFATVAYGAASGAQLWLKRYDGPQVDDIADSVAISADGRAAFVTGDETVADRVTSGRTLWKKPYPAGSATSAAVGPDVSSLFVTGGQDDYVTVAYRST